MDREIERCRREIAAIKAELLAGNPDVAGLCLALADWSTELRLIERQRHAEASPTDREPGGCDSPRV
jgi:hypothetical protein